MTLLDAFNIGKTGLMAHSQRLDMHAKNMANLDTPNYIRKIPVLMAKEDISFKGLLNNIKEDVFALGEIPYLTGGVSCNGYVEDPTLGEIMYEPGHPDADEHGFIRSSNVDPLVEMADATMTSRAYEANLALITITKTMAQRAAEIGK